MSSIGRGFFRRVDRHRLQALRTVLTRLLACLLMCLPLAAAAAEREPARRALAPQSGVSQDRALNLVREAVDGRVLSVVPIESGRRGYQVRILLDGGRIQTIRVSPRGRLERR
ncbi:MAG: hypothetical protein OXF68_13995 [Gammaproteobacteria bacterium]|nr:hypothetical protein [Gammaproteobacteria bacterium]